MMKPVPAAKVQPKTPVKPLATIVAESKATRLKAIKPNSKPSTGATIKALRVSSKLNQADFWERFGVTQSGASRYEAGRARPMPLRLLMVLRMQGKITDEDLAAAAKIAKQSK